jgi:hypothetical protein
MIKHQDIGFSVTMKSKKNIKSLIVSAKPNGKVMFDGNLGELEEMGIMDSLVLKIRGTEGTLLLDLCEDDIREMISRSGK